MSAEKILVADDDLVILTTLCEVLTEAGYRVSSAHDGLQALALCKIERPDLALLDIRMPGLDGIALAQSVCKEPGVPFLILSAYDDEDFIKPAVEAGALGYLIKPLSLPIVLRTIRVALARAKEISELRQRKQDLEAAIASNRIIGTAIGMVMKESKLTQEEAFERLRRYARGQRRKLEDVAQAIVADKERLE